MNSLNIECMCILGFSLTSYTTCFVDLGVSFLVEDVPTMHMADVSEGVEGVEGDAASMIT